MKSSGANLAGYSMHLFSYTFLKFRKKIKRGNSYRNALANKCYRIYLNRTIYLSENPLVNNPKKWRLLDGAAHSIFTRILLLLLLLSFRCLRQNTLLKTQYVCVFVDVWCSKKWIKLFWRRFCAFSEFHCAGPSTLFDRSPLFDIQAFPRHFHTIYLYFELLQPLEVDLVRRRFLEKTKF